jgi:hypothetical protein
MLLQSAQKPSSHSVSSVSMTTFASFQTRLCGMRMKSSSPLASAASTASWIVACVQPASLPTA